MNKNRFLSLALVCLMTLSLLSGCVQGDAPAGASSGAAPAAESGAAPVAESGAAPAAESGEEPVTLRFFTLNVDRTQGEGLVEQILLDAYMAENPGVTVEVEALENESYKQKFKAYVAGNDLADLFYVWGYGSFLNPLEQGNYLAELNDADYADYTFQESALLPFRDAEGTLYGLPRSLDSYVMFYNKRIFEENNVTVPSTFEELVEVGKTLRANGVMPCADNGGEKWALTVLFEHIFFQYTQDVGLLNDIVLTRSSKFSDHPEFLYVAEKCAELGSIGFFQDSYLSDDYAAMQNLFQQEQVAMMYMGNWLGSMYFDPNIPQEARDNFSIFPLPPLEGSKGNNTDNVAMVGGGYSLSASSPRLEEARKLLNYMLLPDNWCKTAWEKSGIFSPQDMTPYITEEQKAGLQGDMLAYMGSITNMTGQAFNELGSPAYKTDAQDLVQELFGAMATPEDFLTRLDEAADRSYEAVLAGDVAE